MKHSYMIAFWSPFPIHAADYCIDFFASFFRRQDNIECVCCRSSRDKRTRRILRDADLLVVVLHQKYQEMADWLVNDFYRTANCFYMIIDYFPDNRFNLSRIERDFRIPHKRLACIPYNAHYHEAVRTENVPQYWLRTGGHHICQAGMDFRRELDRTANLMLKALDDAECGI